MNNVKLLDCTLRDGGYVNNWEFGCENIKKIIYELDKSGLDYIECGFLASKEVTENQSLYNKISDVNEYIGNTDKTKLTVMISNTKFDIANLSDYNKNSVKNIRYIFKKHNLKAALEECKIVKEKGYNLFINPTFISEYTFDELKSLIKSVNKISPYCFSIVDSIGILDFGNLNSLINYVDKYLNPDISLCLHLHNNLGIAFNNIVEALKIDLKRNIIVDSTIRGIGRGSGNLPVELIVMYLNKKFGFNYDIKNIYKTYEKYLVPNPKLKRFKMQNAYYYSAINRVHPNYADFIMENNISDKTIINKLLQKIPPEFKTVYNEELITALHASIK